MIYRSRTTTGDRYTEIILPSKPYKVFVSGGFDSALLLFILCSQARDINQSTVTAAVVDRGFGSVNFARRVCSWAGQRTGIKVDVQELKISPELPHGQHISEPAASLHEQGFITISADTQNPENVDFPGAEPKRIPPNSRFTNWLFPFSGIDKTHTLFIAKQLGVLDEIATITHTCTDSHDLRCGKCWQCSERIWAFDQLGWTDIGKY